MKLKELFCVLCIYHFNFRNMHWNSVGENFDNAHKEITTEYYEMLDGTIDTVGEMLTRLGINPCNYVEVLKFIKETDGNYMVVESSQLYDRTAIVTMSETMLTDIVKLMVAAWDSEEMKNPMNVGIKSTLESLINDYDMQARYINKRKMDAVGSSAPLVHPTVNDHPHDEEQMPPHDMDDELDSL